MAFEVKLDQFSGPLHLLLEIIEKQDLPITDISLAQVTDDYLRHIDSNEVPPEELADFLVVATKLLLIKSKAILPTLQLEEEDDADSLAIQLKMYKEFVDASKHIEELYGASFMFARQRVSAPKPEGFVPPGNVNQGVLSEAFKRMLKRLEPFFALEEQSMKRVASVQERISSIREAIHARSRMTFKDVVKGSKSKVEVVVSFLALLELMKQKIVDVSQQDTFSDITITHVD